MKHPASDVKAIILDPLDPQYPPLLKKNTPGGNLPNLTILGNPGLLLRQSIGLICSRHCPGSIILQMEHVAQKLKLHPCVVVGGFHSPMERECFEVFLRGRAGIVLCPARSLHRFRIRPRVKEALLTGRLAIASPFGRNARRSTRDLAGLRNSFVASVSSAVIIPHAPPGSATEGIARELIASGKTVLTFDHPSNDNLLCIGVQRLEWSTLHPGLGVNVTGSIPRF